MASNSVMETFSISQRRQVCIHAPKQIECLQEQTPKNTLLPDLGQRPATTPPIEWTLMVGETKLDLRLLSRCDQDRHL